MPGPYRYREQLSGLMTSIDPYTVGADSISARGSMRQRKPRGGVKTAWRRTTSAASQQSWPAHAVVCPAGANIVRSPISLRSTVGPRSQPRTSAGRRGRRPLQHNPQSFSLPQTSAAAWGQAALHPTLPHSVGRAFARNSSTPPCRDRAFPARNPAITTPYPLHRRAASHRAFA